MAATGQHDERIANMSFASIYPMYLNKVEKKGRTKTELDQAICWLTGYSGGELQQLTCCDKTLREFFAGANLHPNAHLITGVICGQRIEDIATPLTRQVRYMDKLVDELARGRKMEKILRSA